MSTHIFTELKKLMEQIGDASEQADLNFLGVLINYNAPGGEWALSHSFNEPPGHTFLDCVREALLQAQEYKEDPDLPVVMTLLAVLAGWHNRVHGNSHMVQDSDSAMWKMVEVPSPTA